MCCLTPGHASSGRRQRIVGCQGGAAAAGHESERRDDQRGEQDFSHRAYLLGRGTGREIRLGLVYGTTPFLVQRPLPNAETRGGDEPDTPAEKCGHIAAGVSREIKIAGAIDINTAAVAHHVVPFDPIIAAGGMNSRGTKSPRRANFLEGQITAIAKRQFGSLESRESEQIP